MKSLSQSLFGFFKPDRDTNQTGWYKLNCDKDERLQPYKQFMTDICYSHLHLSVAGVSVN